MYAGDEVTVGLRGLSQTAVRDELVIWWYCSTVPALLGRVKNREVAECGMNDDGCGGCDNVCPSRMLLSAARRARGCESASRSC